jgi:hypothetical protein
MNHRFATILALICLLAVVPVAPAAAAEEKESGPVKGHFSPGGTVLTITSQSEFEELWGLQVDYCDGTREEIGRHVFRIKFRVPLGSEGYSFYADKPMHQVLIKTLPPVENGNPPDDFRITKVQHNCENPEPLPNLYCNDARVAREIHRSWEGEPLSFKSNRHVVFAGLKFPGVDGLAPARQPDTHPNRYHPSVKFEPASLTWDGTFISTYVPVGEYSNVVLVVKDDFGQQAKCPVGKVTILP